MGVPFSSPGSEQSYRQSRPAPGLAVLAGIGVGRACQVLKLEGVPPITTLTMSVGSIRAAGLPVAGTL